MTTGKPTTVVPNLRFPEFRNAGAWHFQPLSDIAEPISERVGTSECVPMSVTTGVGLLSQEEKFGRIIAGKSYKNYIRLQTNDFAYNKSATKDFPQGYIARYSGAKDAAVPNSIFTCFRPDATSVIPEYLDHLLHGNHHGRWLRKYITVGARAHGALSVTDDALMSMPVPLPPVPVSRSEQKKIADCLGSLDDLIAAEGRKLEALRQHKQGLIQQLFPRPNETVPRLRFPEFRGDTTWLAPQLGELYGFKRTTTLSRANLNYEFGTLRTLHYGDIPTKFAPLFRMEDEHVPYITLDVASNGFDDEAFCEEGDIVLADASEDLDGVGTAIEVVSLNGERVVAGTHTILATRRGSVPVVGFGGLLFQSAAVRTAIKREAQGAKIYGISATRISAIPIPIPPTEAEQQRIAKCLASLEDVLAARARMIDTLKQRKQGLLQQLYPSLET